MGTYDPGPERPEPQTDFTDFRQPDYLSGYANKIIHDLEKVARVVDGRYTKIFTLGKESRCPDCTDSITGARVFTNCSTCDGTGYTQGYISYGFYWVRVDFNPVEKISSAQGNIENRGGRDQLQVIAAPLLEDKDLVVFYNTKEVYKVVDRLAQVGAMNGFVILQTIGCLRLSEGSPEYLVIDW